MRRLTLLLALLLCFVVSSAVSAAPIVVPTHTDFGTLTEATFSGSGIPNTAVAITTSGTITLGLTAHQRGTNPAVTNNGNGTFFAEAGPDASVGPPAQPGYATWNFGFYAYDSANENTSTQPMPTAFLLTYDFDPAFANDRSNHGTVFIPGNFENSWNLGMNFLSLPLSGVTPPSFTPFSNMNEGWYTFSLQALQNQQVVAETSMRVQVGDPPPVPEPATLALLGFGLISGIRRFRRRQ